MLVRCGAIRSARRSTMWRTMMRSARTVWRSQKLRISYSHDIYDERRAYATGIESDRYHKEEAPGLCKDVRGRRGVRSAPPRRLRCRLPRRRVHAARHGDQVRWLTRQGRTGDREESEQLCRRRENSVSQKDESND